MVPSVECTRPSLYQEGGVSVTRRLAWLVLVSIIVLATVAGLALPPTEETPAVAPTPSPTPTVERHVGECSQGEGIPTVGIERAIKEALLAPSTFRWDSLFGVPTELEYAPDESGYGTAWLVPFEAQNAYGVPIPHVAYGLWTPDCIVLLVDIE